MLVLEDYRIQDYSTTVFNKGLSDIKLLNAEGVDVTRRAYEAGLLVVQEEVGGFLPSLFGEDRFFIAAQALKITGLTKEELRTL